MGSLHVWIRLDARCPQESAAHEPSWFWCVKAPSETHEGPYFIPKTCSEKIRFKVLEPDLPVPDADLCTRPKANPKFAQYPKKSPLHNICYSEGAWQEYRLNGRTDCKTHGDPSWCKLFENSGSGCGDDMPECGGDPGSERDRMSDEDM